MPCRLETESICWPGCGRYGLCLMGVHAYTCRLSVHARCARRFRVVVRSVAAFLSVQVQSETELRLQPTTELQLSAKAQQVGNTNSWTSSLLSFADLCCFLSRVTFVFCLFGCRRWGCWKQCPLISSTPSSRRLLPKPSSSYGTQDTVSETDPDCWPCSPTFSTPTSDTCTLFGES